jgi:soluble lytic murein transglycosylase-like protein
LPSWPSLPSLPQSTQAAGNTTPAPAPAPAPAQEQAQPEPTPAPGPSATALPAGRQHYDGLIQQAANRHGVDPNLVRAVVTAESDYDPRSHSSAGAMGLMQLMPDTAKDMGVANPWDPAQNIDGGTRYLAHLLRRFDGDEKKALAAYNWGPGNLERGGRMPEETRNYLKKVARFKQMHATSFSRQA